MCNWNESANLHRLLNMDLRGPPASAGGSVSPYLFRPILEPPEDGSKPNLPHPGGFSGGGIVSTSTQSSFVSGVPISSVGISGGSLTSAERLSVTSRIRINSGSSALPVNSPTNSLSVNKAPKLYNCWRNSQEAWSSQGSRQSSRPGSSASSRPSSQCNNLLYNRSNNNSLTDVSVARNFQQLSVSTRRAAFKTQKWSHSFDQSCATSSAQTSPGRRRQASLKQKSLDLDSGYLGSSNGDLKSSQSSYSQSSWVNDYPHNNVCSPIADATLELRELCSEVEEQEHSRAQGVSYNRRGDLKDDLSRSSSLPSFPETFSNPTSLRQHILESQQNRLPILESAQDLSTVDQDEEQGDDLDEEIKMIVALGESIPQLPPKPPLPTLSLGDDEVQSFLDTHCAEEGPSEPPQDNEGDYTVDAVLIVPPLVQRPNPRPIRLPSLDSLRSINKPVNYQYTNTARCQNTKVVNSCPNRMQMTFSNEMEADDSLERASSVSDRGSESPLMVKRALIRTQTSPARLQQTPLSPQDRNSTTLNSRPSISIKEESPEVKMVEGKWTRMA